MKLNRLARAFQVLAESMVLCVLISIIQLLALWYGLSWYGSGQIYSIEILNQRLRRGLTLEETLSELELRAEDCTPQFNERLRQSSCRIAHSGWGSIFVPQHNTWLWFDESMKLTGYNMEWNQLAGELNYSHDFGETSAVR